MDERPHYVCCQSATDEDLGEEPEQFDCANCHVANALDDLWPENVEAWRLFQRLASRLVVDAHLGTWAMLRLTARRTPSEAEALLDRLALLYDLLLPVQRGTDGA